MKRGFVGAASTHRQRGAAGRDATASGSQHVKKVPIPPQVPLRSTRNLLLEEYVFSMHQIGDLYKDIIVRESVKGRRGIGVHEQ